MTADHIVAFAPLALGMVAIAAFGAWVFIHSNRRYLLRWAVIPAALGAAVAIARIYDVRLGYAAPGALPERFAYLGHHVVVQNGHKAALEVWVQAGRTRLVRIPYSKPAEEALEQAKAAGKKGGTVVMSKGGKGGKGGEEGKESPYESNVLLPSDIDPK